MTRCLVCPSCAARWKITEGDGDEPALCPNCTPKPPFISRYFDLPKVSPTPPQEAE